MIPYGALVTLPTVSMPLWRGKTDTEVDCSSRSRGYGRIGQVRAAQTLPKTAAIRPLLPENGPKRRSALPVGIDGPSRNTPLGLERHDERNLRGFAGAQRQRFSGFLSVAAKPRMPHASLVCSGRQALEPRLAVGRRLREVRRGQHV